MPVTGLPSVVEFLIQGLLSNGGLLSWDSHGSDTEVVVTLKFSAVTSTDTAPKTTGEGVVEKRGKDRPESGTKDQGTEKSSQEKGQGKGQQGKDGLKQHEKQQKQQRKQQQQHSGMQHQQQQQHQQHHGQQQYHNQQQQHHNQQPHHNQQQHYNQQQQQHHNQQQPHHNQQQRHNQPQHHNQQQQMRNHHQQPHHGHQQPPMPPMGMPMPHMHMMHHGMLPLPNMNKPQYGGHFGVAVYSKKYKPGTKQGQMWQDKRDQRSTSAGPNGNNRPTSGANKPGKGNKQQQQQPKQKQPGQQPNKQQQQNKQPNKQKQNKNKNKQQKQPQQPQAEKSDEDNNSGDDTNNGGSGGDCETSDWSEQMDAKNPISLTQGSDTTTSTDTDHTAREDESSEPLESVDEDVKYKEPCLLEKTYPGAIPVPCMVKELSSNQCSNMIDPDTNYYKCDDCGKTYCTECAERGLANPRAGVPASLFPCFKGHQIH